MIEKKISQDEIIKLIEETYKVKDVRFMRHNNGEKDSKTIDDFDYVLGVETDRK